MKKLILFLTLTLSSIIGFCYDLPNNSNSIVNDFANIIQNPNELKAFITNNKQQVKYVVVSISKLPSNTSIEDYTANLGNKWKIGDNGILILFSIDDRKSRISVGKALTTKINNDIATDAANKMRPFFKEGDFSGGIKEAINYINTYINVSNNEGAVPTTDFNTKSEVPYDYETTIISMLVFGFSVYILSFFWKKRNDKIEVYKNEIEKIINTLKKYITDLEKLSYYETSTLVNKNGLKIIDLIKNINKHIKYYESIKTTYSKDYDKINLSVIDYDVRWFVEKSKLYINYKNKSIEDYLKLIEGTYNRKMEYINTYIKGEFLKSISLESFNNSYNYYKQAISEIIIDKTNFDNLENSIKKLENCVKYFDKNGVEPLSESIKSAYDKSTYIDKIETLFETIISYNKELTKEKWCSSDTKKKVLSKLNKYSNDFKTFNISYTENFYNEITKFISLVKKDADLELLQNEKNDYELEERRRDERRRDDERRREERRRDDERRNSYNNNYYGNNLFSSPSNNIFSSPSNDSFSSPSNDSFSSSSGGTSDW